MYVKKIKFEDFNGKQREQTFLFNLTEAELTEMQLSHDGGMQEYIQRIVDAQKTSDLVVLFKELILKSYGEKSDDGMSFIKKDPVRGKLADYFEQTAAYNALFTELASDDKAAAEFINGIIPNKVREEAKKQEGHAYPAPIAKG